MVGSWSIHRRIVVMTVATLGLALGLGVSAFAVSLDRILYAAAQDTAKTSVAHVAGAIRSGQATPAQAVAQTASRGSILQVLDAAGAVVASSEVSLHDEPIAEPETGNGSVDQAQSASVPGELGEPHAVVSEGVVDRSGSQFTVVVAKPLQVESATVRTATILLAVGSLLLLVLVVGLVSRGVHRALAPVESIREDVDRISEARGPGHVTVPPTADEVARLAVTMNRMLDRLATADAATRQFVSDASHELRSPIATIRASMEVGNGGPPAEHEERDAVVLAETLRMQRLVDDLLTLAKADDGAPQQRQDVDLDDLATAEVRRLLTTQVTTVRASIHPVRVTGDEARLAQLLRNLVDNASRYAHDVVALDVHGEGDEAVLRVDNDGPLIPVAHREDVFSRFARLDEARGRDRGGSGLGLAIVRSIVEAHGGSVVATQSPAGLCRFEVRLPRQPPPPCS